MKRIWAIFIIITSFVILSSCNLMNNKQMNDTDTTNNSGEKTNDMNTNVEISDNDKNVEEYEIYYDLLDFYPYSNGTFGVSAGKTKNLDKIVIPPKYKGKEVSIIEENGFNQCKHLKEIIIPNSIKSIKKNAFSGCLSLETLEIPYGVIDIEDFAFRSCTSLIDIKISNSVVNVGCDVFKDCHIESATIPFCFLDEMNKYYLKNLVLTSGNEIKNSRFIDYSALTKVSLPNGLKSIGNLAFSGCINLTTITFPDSLETIGMKAFYNCTSLDNIVFPKKLIKIGSSSFSGCSNLVSISIPDSLENVEYNAFSGCDKLQFNEYKNGHYLGNEDNKYIILFKLISNDIENFEINNKTKIIYQSVFEGSLRMNSLYIPDSIHSIGLYAFKNCISLKKIIIPDSVINIGSGAFLGCISLENISLSNNLSFLSSGIFEDCFNLQNVCIPNSISAIYSDAFRECRSINNIELPENISQISSNVFSGCSSLKTISILNSEIKLDNMTFNECRVSKIYYKGRKKYSDILDDQTIIIKEISDVWYSFSEFGELERESGNWWYYDNDGKTIIEKIIP